MPVEQGLPWHPVAMGLAGQAIPFIVAASHAHAPPSAPFWFPVPAILVASPALLAPPPCLLCSPLSLLVWVPRSVCVRCSSPCLLALLGAPFAHPLLPHPPAPPYEDFTSPYDVDCPVRGCLVTALLPPPWRASPSARGAAPALVEYVGTLLREGGRCLLMPPPPYPERKSASWVVALRGHNNRRTTVSPAHLDCKALNLYTVPEAFNHICQQSTTTSTEICHLTFVRHKPGKWSRKGIRKILLPIKKGTTSHYVILANCQRRQSSNTRRPTFGTIDQMLTHKQGQ